MKSPVLVFDFDGTIADTHHYIIEISNRLAPEFKYKLIAPEEIDDLKDKSAQEIIVHLHVPFLKIPAIVARGKREFQINIAGIQPIKGLEVILTRLKDLNVQIGILSSNTTENINQFLKNHNLHCFNFIATTSKIWGKDISLKDLIHKNNLPKEQVIYIGDETRDVLAAKKLGVKVAAVTWGYNSALALKNTTRIFSSTNLKNCSLCADKV